MRRQATPTPRRNRPQTVGCAAQLRTNRLSRRDGADYHLHTSPCYSVDRILAYCYILTRGLIVFTCTTMRTAVSVSLILLVSGLLLEFFTVKAVFPIPLSYLAILAVLASAALLAVIFILALIPAIARRLDGCQH